MYKIYSFLNLLLIKHTLLGEPESKHFIKKCSVVLHKRNTAKFVG